MQGGRGGRVAEAAGWQRWQGSRTARLHQAGSPRSCLCTEPARSGRSCFTTRTPTEVTSVPALHSWHPKSTCPRFPTQSYALLPMVSGDPSLRLLSWTKPSLPLAFFFPLNLFMPGAHFMLLAGHCPPGAATSVRAPAPPQGHGWALPVSSRGCLHGAGRGATTLPCPALLPGGASWKRGTVRNGCSWEPSLAGATSPWPGRGQASGAGALPS